MVFCTQVLNVEPANLEPFQLLRYQPGEYYKTHHDHAGYYSETDTKIKDRPQTMLLFLNDVARGGHLRFDKLGLEIPPRMGDAVVWSNVDLATGKADPDMIHQGLPPDVGAKMAVNIWVRDEPFTSPRQAAMAAAERDGKDVWVRGT